MLRAVCYARRPITDIVLRYGKENFNSSWNSSRSQLTITNLKLVAMALILSHTGWRCDNIKLYRGTCSSFWWLAGSGFSRRYHEGLPSCTHCRYRSSGRRPCSRVSDERRAGRYWRADRTHGPSRSRTPASCPSHSRWSLGRACYEGLRRIGYSTSQLSALSHSHPRYNPSSHWQQLQLSSIDSRQVQFVTQTATLHILGGLLAMHVLCHKYYETHVIVCASTTTLHIDITVCDIMCDMPPTATR